MVFLPSGGQEIIRYTLSSAGSASYNNGIVIKQTIGQPGGASVMTNDFGVLRQGFQQAVTLPIPVTSPLPFDDSGQLVFGMYPNPARGVVYIELPDDTESFEIHITDMYGKMVYQRKPVEQGSIDLQHLSSGIYFITISSEGKRGTKKLVLL